MAKKSKQTQKPKTFDDHVREALEHFNQPRWLAANSLLATPYLIGEYMTKIHAPVHDDERRGVALQQLLRNAAAEIQHRDSKKGEDYHNLIDTHYFQGVKKREEAAHKIGVSRASFFTYRKEALSLLSTELARLLKPALSAETPPRISSPIGQEERIETCVEALRTQQTVALFGPGGIGKTTLGSAITQAAAPHPIFWYTIRPGLNDDLNTFLFELGFFLHRHGASTLWRQLVAHEDPGNFEGLLSVIRHQLGELTRKDAPILCIDEVDLLRKTDVETHERLLTLIDSLHGLVGILLIGQQVAVEADVYHTLEGLTVEQVHTLFSAAQIHLAHKQITQLHAYTQGNPRLLELIIDLQQSGVSTDDLLANLPTVPSVEFLLERVCKRLPPAEMQALLFFSVFRRPVSLTHFLRQNVQAKGQTGKTMTGKTTTGKTTNTKHPFEIDIHPVTLTRLHERHLLQSDQQGRYSLLTIYRTILYQYLLPEQKQALHLNAAHVRQNEAQYTAAAYHYVQAEQTADAIDLWYTYMNQEINQGQSSSAYTLFSQVQLDHLDAGKQEKLALIRSKLQTFAGKLDDARAELAQIIWRTPTLKLERQIQDGRIANTEGDQYRAIEAYQSGLAIAKEWHLGRVSILHKEMGWSYMRENMLNEAWHEAQIAECEALNFKGLIRFKLGGYDEAQTYYEQALQLAETLDYQEGIAKTCLNLGGLWVYHQHDVDQTIAYLQRAADRYKFIGKMSESVMPQLNLATVFNLAGRPLEAIEVAIEVLNLQTIQQTNALMNVMALQILAEAYLGSGDLDEAEKFAGQVIHHEDSALNYEALRTLGTIRLRQGDAQEAESHIVSSLEQIQEPFGEAYSQRALAEVYQAQERVEEAVAAFDKAIRIFTELGLDKEIEKTKSMMSSS
ncbi:MAG: tetratricopeptide repeat protein [Chloroflexota bacterium]